MIIWNIQTGEHSRELKPWQRAGDRWGGGGLPELENNDRCNGANIKFLNDPESM